MADEMLAEDATIDRLTKAVVGGRDMDQIVRTPQKGKGELMLEAKELCVKNDKGLIALHDISFQLHAGEIFAIAGVAGSIIMNGRDITKTAAKERIDIEISFIPEDRLKMGLVPGMDMIQNAILKIFKTRACSAGGVILGD